ncbi:MFS multidrug transporter [Niveomyces insectorum RCEF 264]|uniref:MFS multidrug transporter n=1 Tax=Niveomyces insectorum RCEF 264 TaxID=1081102 RepID=A0A167XX61_9HYPO|nr:MFS multidrug transporter [Niveomyces insectorum RCEF 264]
MSVHKNNLDEDTITKLDATAPGATATRTGSKGGLSEKQPRDEVSADISVSDEEKTAHHGEGTASSKPEYVTGLRFYIIVASLVLAALLAALNAAMLATATPSITNAFHSIQDVGWYGSSYLISNCAMLPLTGKLFAIFPLKHTFISFIFVFEMGALISGVAVSSTMLIVGRAISGIGASGIVTGATTIITVLRPLDKRPMLMGVLMGFVAIGQVAAPLLGGALSEVSWRWVFYINLPLGGVVIFLFVFVARVPASTGAQKPTSAPSRDNDNDHDPAAAQSLSRSHFTAMWHQLGHIDFVGFVCFAAACATFLMGLEWGGTAHPWNSSVVVGLLCGGAALFVVFGVWSAYMGDRALLPLRLLRHSYINVFCGLTAATQWGSVFVLMYYLPIWFQGVKGATPIVSGVMLLPTILSQLFASFLCGYLVQKTGYYLPEVLFGNAVIAVASGLFTTFSPTTPTGSWIGYQILGGVGRGFVIQLLITVIQANVPPADVPLGTSYVMFCQYFAGAVFLCAARTVLTSTMGAALAEYAPGVDSGTVINTGVTELRKVIPADQIKGVILAYNKALVNVFYLQLALSGTAFVCAWFLGWKDVRKMQPVQQKQSDSEAESGRKQNEP